MIKIANRLRPFSHLPGVPCLIPGTSWYVEAYPTRLFFQNIDTEEKCLVDMDVAGPIDNFTCQQDLEKAKIYVFGKETRGYFRLEIFANCSGIEIKLDRCFAEGIFFVLNKKEEKRLYPHDRLSLPIGEEKVVSFSKDVERLCLGSHKKQDWDLVLRRKDLREIFPIWLKLGIHLPEKEPPQGYPLLDECKRKIQQSDRSHICQSFLNLFQVGFKGIMCPTREDQNFLGLSNASPFPFSPFILLQKGAKYIRSLFFQQEETHMKILPCLPKSFVFGRYIHIQCDEIGSLDMHWSKGKIQKMVLRASFDKKIHFTLQKPLQCFRMRSKRNEIGKIYPKNEYIQLNCGKTYIFDHFK